MRYHIPLGIIIIIIGIIFILLTLGDIFSSGVTTENSLLLVLGCILMVLGVLVRYKCELIKDKEEIENGKKELREEMRKIEKLEKRGVSNWRLRDLEYKVKRLNEGR